MAKKASTRLGSSHTLVRIGAAIGPHDPYWVQVRETAYRKIAQLGASLVPLEISDSNETLFSLDPASLAEELLAQDLDAVVYQSLPPGTLYQLVYNDMPVVSLGESQLEHRLYSSPRGLNIAGQMAAEYVAQKLNGRGRVLCVGGHLDQGEDKGISRISGFNDTLRRISQISILHCPTAWRYDKAYPTVYSVLKYLGSPVDAIFGLSDSLALAGRDAARALGLITPQTVVIGINGDPLALAAVADGSFSATVDTSAEDLGISAATLAYEAALGKPLPPHYAYTIRLITAENVNEHAARKLFAIADLPSQLVGVNREEERYRLVQLETSAAINQRVGALLDRRQLSREIADLIRVNYGFDHVQLFMWSERNQMLVEGLETSSERQGIPFTEAGLLAEAIRRKETIFIPDIRHSRRFDPDPKWPETRARVVLPIRLGGKILGLLDLHGRRPIFNLRWDLIGLQLMADQFGIALRNAELYSEAISARETAEHANQLKTRLMANVTHELRTPLNVILGYSQSALSTPNLYGMELPENLRRDLRYIYQSGEHLIRIINDLLDLSRAEVGELNIFPEPLDPRLLMQEIFDSMAKTGGPDSPDVTWELHIPRRLPIIQADPVRLRQILLNLLINAGKFTSAGKICLGAEVEPPHLHIWVSDSGMGIPIEQQERIFEPFVTGSLSARRKGGVGLGLSITRRLVALHGGSMSLESQPEHGSTFHVYWPLPNLAEEMAPPQELGTRPALLLLTAGEAAVCQEPPEEVRAIAARQKLEILRVHSGDDLDDLLREVQPAALAWDLYSAGPADWNIIQRVRRHPQLSSLPLILFGQESAGGPAMGVTDVLTKPLNGRKLADLIDSLCPQRPSGTVLVVDDDPQARLLYQRIIQEALPGFAVLLAEEGEQALALLQSEVPALVILDLIMPNVDGFQVLETIRMDQRTCKVPVVVLSGKILTFDDVNRLNFANVTFHSKGMLSAEEIIQALQTTFSGEMHLGQPTSFLVKQALAYLHQNFDQPVTRGKLAEAVGVSDHYLTQIFHQELDLSPMELLNRLRIQKARELLRGSDDSITAIAAKVGFGDPAYFSRVFRKLTGCSPQVYRR